MNSEQTLKLTNEFAPVYDQHVKNSAWKGPDFIFEVLKNYIKKDDMLLDIGIGTGLASVPFHKAGLKIVGIDGSSEMLKICEKKNIAEQLILTDISKASFEIPDIEFDVIISNAVFHMVGDLSYAINLAAKHLKTNAYICFTVIPHQPNEEEGFTKWSSSGIYSKVNEENNLMVFRHPKFYIQNLLMINKLQLIQNQVFIGFKNTEEDREVSFEYYLAKKLHL